jgi:hypothetical protein
VRRGIVVEAARFTVRLSGDQAFVVGEVEAKGFEVEPEGNFKGVPGSWLPPGQFFQSPDSIFDGQSQTTVLPFTWATLFTVPITLITSLYPSSWPPSV